MKKEFKGIYSALVTPFTSEGKVDLEKLKKFIKFEVQKLNIDGLYICGSTAEAFLLDKTERSQIMQTVAEYVRKDLKSKITLIAQVGGLNIFDMKSLASEAKKFGYDAISAVTPFYYSYKFEDLENYYQIVAKTIDLPLFIYYLPALTAINISNENFNKLLKIKNVAGVKYSSPDLFLLERLIQENPNKFFLYGVDEFLMAATTLGIHGAIGSTYNLLGKKAKAIFELTQKNKISEARKLTHEYNFYLKQILDGGVYQSMKQAVSYACDAGKTYCRPPLGQIDNKADNVAKNLVKSLFNKQIK